ncbi:cytochrome P450 306a1 isoform X1 [Microplitis demolitor]|uniref:cytochrome P450 306a1 isoform X1 n=1 Tax=Microplitis demolitor TaxID=69319 RepID=UPI0004CD42A8|nr:cytochrome P450 306a1 isoform X1 [Microplitis demolitor]
MLLLCLITIILLLISILVMAKNNKKKNYPPGPRGFPIIGSLLSINSKEPHISLTKLSEKYGAIYSLRMGSVYTVVLSDPKLVRQALAKDAFSGRAPLYLTHGIMNGYGIICAEGEIWKEQRKFVSITLKNLGMIKYGPKRDIMEIKIRELTNEAIQKLKDKSIINVKNGIDPIEILHNCIGNIMNNLVFGKVYNENDEIWKWLRELQEEGVKHIGVAGALNFLPFLKYIPYYKNLMKSLIDGKLKTHKYYRKLIDEYKYKNNLNNDNDDNFLAAFYNEMTKRQNNNSDNNVGSFTEQQYYHLLADIFGAGTDTTLTTIRWFLLYMAILPNQQEKIYQEIKTIVGNKQEITLEDSCSLILLQASICEIQRLKTVVPVGIPHGAIVDDKIGDYDIPKGAMIIPLQWAIHMNPNYWENPNEFIPERFISPDGFLIKPCAFIPFQTGKRMCVGDELAKMIMIIFISTIIKEFKISIPSDDEPIDLNGDCGITLVPKNYKLTFIARQ